MNFNPDAYNTPNVDVSPLSFQTYFPTNSPKKGTWLEPWFGASSHLDVGYKSNDPATVVSQVATLIKRGFDFLAINWYGPDVEPHHTATMLLVAECAKQGLKCIIGLDKGAWTFGMPKATDPTAYGISMMHFMSSNFFNSPAYMKHTDGRYILAAWDCAAVAGMDVAKVFNSVPNVAVLFDKATGVSKPASSGCFGWAGLPDIGAYQADFLASVTKAKANKPDLIVMSSLCKGFDDGGRRITANGPLDPTKSCWNQTQPRRFVDENQGQQFLDRITALNAHMQVHPGVVDYILVVTHNDYEENTATSERGIDSQLTVALTASNGVQTAALTGNLNTVDHVDAYVNGKVVWTEAAAASLTFDLNTLKPTNNQQFTFQLIAVGKPLFQNKVSNTVSTTAVTVPAQTVQLPVSTSVQVPLPPSVTVTLDTTVTVPISATVQGLTVSGTLTVPIKQTAEVPLGQTTVSLPVNQTATALVTAQTVWS